MELQKSKVGFPIRKSLDQSLFAAPQSLSQRTTSFIASQRQGIHRIPLRHLIALIINAHPSAEVLEQGLGGPPQTDQTDRATRMAPSIDPSKRPFASNAPDEHQAVKPAPMATQGLLTPTRTP